jgi:excisionase family DNA binding protein
VEKTRSNHASFSITDLACPRKEAILPETATVIAPLLSPDAVAHTLAISRKGVYRLHRDGLLPAVRVRGVLRFEPEAVSRYIAGQRTPGRRAAA